MAVSVLVFGFSLARLEQQRRVRAGRGASVRRPPLRVGSLAMLGRLARRATPFVRYAHSGQTVATSQWLKHASHAARRPALLSASQAHPGRPTPAFADTAGFLGRNIQESSEHSSTQYAVSSGPGGSSRGAVPGRGDFCGGEKRRAGAGARSALQQLTRRDCLTGVSAANEGSFATRSQTEHRNGVGAQRRPPQYEPLTGTARRDALTSRMKKRLLANCSPTHTKTIDLSVTHDNR